MKLLFKKWNGAIPLAAFLITVMLVAWTGDPKQQPGSISTNDTVPGKKKTTSTQKAAEKDLDKELRQIEKAKAELSEWNEKDWNKVKKDFEEAMKKMEVELKKLQEEEFFKKADIEKMQKELEASLKNIDVEKIQKELEKSFREAELMSSREMEKAKKEIAKAKIELERQLKSKDWQKEIEEMQKINMVEVEKEMEKARKEMERVKEDLELSQLNMKKEMEKAREEMDLATEELKGYQEMIYDMEKQGLINTKGDYRIEFEGSELRINGKKQSEQVTNKYKKYFKKDRNKTTIYKKGGDFNIDID